MEETSLESQGTAIDQFDDMPGMEVLEHVQRGPAQLKPEVGTIRTSRLRRKFILFLRPSGFPGARRVGELIEASPATRFYRVGPVRSSPLGVPPSSGG
ncbi:MAG: hypothetical protein BGO49_26120 [Planctomycetales bacterium 71-10]|nr:MAG: hypothetical protein BGO49_26120 [Planctomycetales bacterium 71-10]